MASATESDVVIARQTGTGFETGANVGRTAVQKSHSSGRNDLETRLTPDRTRFRSLVNRVAVHHKKRTLVPSTTVSRSGTKREYSMTISTVSSPGPSRFESIP